MMSGSSSMRLLDGLHAVGRLRDAIAGELQVRRIHLAGVLVVLDDEHERLCSARTWILSAAAPWPAAAA